jgi:putative ABC transport system permease protein
MKSVTRGYVKTGVDSVRNTKWRNFWTMLGVIIGVASVISVVGIGDGIKQQVSAQLHDGNANVIIVRPSSISGGGNSTISTLSGFSVSGTLSSNDLNVVARTPGVSTEASMSAFTAKVRGDQSTFRSGLVLGTTPQLPNLIGQSVGYGTFITNSDMASNDVVLGSEAANALFKEEIPIGQSVYIKGQSFLVVGILKALPTSPLSQDADYNSAVYIPATAADNLTNNTAAVFEILALPDHPKQSKRIVAAITAGLTRAHGGQNDFSVLNANQDAVTNGSVLSLLTELITGIAAISLLVGGVGIMNVMLVSVTERMHEIGIRKAIGATDRQILSQFLIESTMLSMSGGVIGIAIAFAIDGLLRLLTSLRPDIGWQIVVLSVAVSLIIGIFFGSVPALKAARKDPISALRAN